MGTANVKTMIFDFDPSFRELTKYGIVNKVTSKYAPNGKFIPNCKLIY